MIDLLVKPLQKCLYMFIKEIKTCLKDLSLREHSELYIQDLVSPLRGKININGQLLIELWLWCHFQQYFSYIVAVRVLLVEEPGENHRSVAIHWQNLSHNVVLSTPRLHIQHRSWARFELTTFANCTERIKYSTRPWKPCKGVQSI